MGAHRHWKQAWRPLSRVIEGRRCDALALSQGHHQRRRKQKHRRLSSRTMSFKHPQVPRHQILKKGTQFHTFVITLHHVHKGVYKTRGGGSRSQVHSSSIQHRQPRWKGEHITQQQTPDERGRGRTHHTERDGTRTRRQTRKGGRGAGGGSLRGASSWQRVRSVPRPSNASCTADARERESEFRMVGEEATAPLPVDVPFPRLTESQSSQHRERGRA